MDKTGLLAKIYDSVFHIDQGRRWLDTNGLEHEGRVSYRKGLALAMESFRETQTDAAEDLELLVGAEYTFVSQELNYCTPSDKKTINSLTQAVKDFDEAFLALKIIQKAAHYKILEQGISHRRDYRYNGMPKDCFHVACAGHITRIANALKTPGINLAEKTLLEQRLSNIKTAQAVYLHRQKNVLGIKD